MLNLFISHPLQLVCDEKIVSLDVYIEVEFDLTAECDDCPFASMQRGEPVVEGIDVDAMPIKCEICDGVTLFTQGDAIDICIGYDVPSLPPGICMLDVDVQFTIKDYPTSGLYLTADLLNLPPGWFYVGGETCSYPFTPFTGMFKDMSLIGQLTCFFYLLHIAKLSMLSFFYLITQNVTFHSSPLE